MTIGCDDASPWSSRATGPPPEPLPVRQGRPVDAYRRAAVAGQAGEPGVDTVPPTSSSATSSPSTSSDGSPRSAISIIGEPSAAPGQAVDEPDASGRRDATTWALGGATAVVVVLVTAAVIWATRPAADGDPEASESSTAVERAATLTPPVDLSADPDTDPESGLPADPDTEPAVGRAERAAAVAQPWSVVSSLVARPGPPELPSDVDRRWTLRPIADPDAPIAWDRTAVARVVAAEVIVYDLEDGDVRWRAPLPGVDPSITFSDEVVVAATTTGNVNVTIAGFDPVDGDELWRRTVAQAVTASASSPATVFEGRRDGVVVRRLDPLTGAELGNPAEAANVSTADPYFVIAAGDLLAVLDLGTGAQVGPAVPSDGLRSIVPVGGHLVGLTETDELVLFDASGDVVHRRELGEPVAGGVGTSPQLVGPVPGTSIVIVVADTSVGFDVTDRTIEPVWKVDGRVGAPAETDVGPVAVARVTDVTTGRAGHALIDARNGSVLASADRTAFEAAPLVAADGYVVAAAADGGSSVSAFGFDGAERWRVSLPPAASFEIAPGALLVRDSTGAITAFS